MPHVVKRGETLGKIARAHGVTLRQLLDVNPRFRDQPDIVFVGDVLIIPGEELAPAPAVSPAPSEFAARLAAIARALHDQFQFVTEGDPVLCGQIRKWTNGIGAEFTSCTSPNHPWSAVFVSWCVKQAGATRSEFEFSKQHSVFVKKAIKNADTGTGVFHGLPIDAHPPGVGDIIQHNRARPPRSFEFARKNASYKSHSAIVVSLGQDEFGRFALTIGGNESDAIRRTKVRLNAQGFVVQRSSSPYICVIRTLK